jgi:Lar family restriction alleviation protein
MEVVTNETAIPCHECGRVTTVVQYEHPRHGPCHMLAEHPEAQDDEPVEPLDAEGEALLLEAAIAVHRQRLIADHPGRGVTAEGVARWDAAIGLAPDEPYRASGPGRAAKTARRAAAEPPAAPPAVMLPCPFCGCTTLEVEEPSSIGGAWVVCECGAEGPAASDREDAIVKWNTAPRTPAPPHGGTDAKALQRLSYTAVAYAGAVPDEIDGAWEALAAAAHTFADTTLAARVREALDAHEPGRWMESVQRVGRVVDRLTPTAPKGLDEGATPAPTPAIAHRDLKPDNPAEPGETPDEREAAIVRRLAGEWGEIEVGPTESIDDVVSHIHGAGTVIMRMVNEVGDWRDWALRLAGRKMSDWRSDKATREAVEKLLPAAAPHGGEAGPAPSIAERIAAWFDDAQIDTLEDCARYLFTDGSALLRDMDGCWCVDPYAERGRTPAPSAPQGETAITHRDLKPDNPTEPYQPSVGDPVVVTMRGEARGTVTPSGCVLVAFADPVIAYAKELLYVRAVDVRPTSDNPGEVE